MSDVAPPLERPDVPTLFHAGPIQRGLLRVGVSAGVASIGATRAALAGVLLWLPMAVAAFLDGRALPGRVGVPLLFDVAAYVRPLLCVPLMLLAEPVFASALRTVGERLRSRGIVGSQARPGYDALVERSTRAARRRLPELVCLALAAALAFELVSAVRAGTHDEWFAVGAGEGSRMTPAGLWYVFAVHGALAFLTLRWLWLLSVWYRFLFGLARLPLRLFPAHPDRAAGLGFVGKAIASAAPLAVAWSAALSSGVANHMIHRGAKLSGFAVPGGAFLGVVLLALVVPPGLAFVPLLVRTRREGLEASSGQMARCAEGRGVGAGGAEAPVESGAPELGLEDLSILVAGVKAMLPVPIALGSLVALAAAACAPVVPLLFLAFPAAEVFDRLKQLLF